MQNANNKGVSAEHSLISAFVFRCLDGKTLCGNFKLKASASGCTRRFNFHLVKSPEDGLSR